jgi:glycosyltransferase involved in cell wall biosynthesis
MRRGYELPHYKIKIFPAREIVRLLAQKMGQRWLVEHERGWASVDRVWQELDRFAAGALRESHQRQRVRAVYAYEDCAERLFETARELGVRRIYDLPIAYWQTVQRLLQEEARRYPEWEPTLGGTRDSEAKLARKTRELDLAELVICPSAFVLDSLPESVRTSKPCVVAPFGSPSVDQVEHVERKPTGGPLRVLFVGALTQRKGLADLFAAMKLVASNEIELVVMGSLLRPLAWYREQFPHFSYEPPRPHRDVLRLMRTCDVLVLPSIVEGRALVQQEAMACGLPLIVTRNAGGEDLITEGETGFLVPIRAPEVIAEKVNWCVANRANVSGMAIAAQRRASELTWHGYGEKVVAAIRSLTGE